MFPYTWYYLRITSTICSVHWSVFGSKSRFSIWKFEPCERRKGLAVHFPTTLLLRLEILFALYMFNHHAPSTGVFLFALFLHQRWSKLCSPNGFCLNYSRCVIGMYCGNLNSLWHRFYMWLYCSEWAMVGHATTPLWWFCCLPGVVYVSKILVHSNL